MLSYGTPHHCLKMKTVMYVKFRTYHKATVWLHIAIRYFTCWKQTIMQKKVEHLEACAKFQFLILLSRKLQQLWKGNKFQENELVKLAPATNCCVIGLS